MYRHSSLQDRQQGIIFYGWPKSVLLTYSGIEGIEEIDWTQYEGIVEIVAGLHAVLEEWQTLKYTVSW